MQKANNKQHTHSQFSSPGHKQTKQEKKGERKNVTQKTVGHTERMVWVKLKLLFTLIIMLQE